jgi:hypothetical protein
MKRKHAFGSYCLFNKKDIRNYLIQKQNETNSGKYNSDIHVHLFHCLVDFRNAGSETSNARDDVVLIDRSVWSIEKVGDLWRTFFDGDCYTLSRM